MEYFSSGTEAEAPPGPAPQESRPTPLETIPSGLPLLSPFLGPPKSQNDRNVPLPPTIPATNFQGTLPVLVGLSLLVVTSKFVVYLSEESVMPAQIVTLVFQACMALLVALVFARKRENGTNALAGSTAQVLAALVLFFGACRVLSPARVAGVFFCLFLNAWNPYTALAFFFDLYRLYQDSVASVLLVLVGYTALLAAYHTLHKTVMKRAISRPNLTVVGPAMALSVVSAVLLFPSLVNVPLLLINSAVLVLLVFSLPEAYIRTKINILVVCAFTYLLEALVLRSAEVSFVEILVSVMLPLMIRIDYSEVFKPTTDTETTHSPIIKDLLSHSDTRAIFHFLLLNSAFMLVQLLYSFRSKSLGLLSDSLHMALDCSSLALGLVAGIMLKHPINPNGKYPFGLRHFEILAGFANGALLVGISGSIIFEAIGRLFVPVALEKTTELIVVSILGLLVNIVGIFAFNHGHSHSHSHSHSHAHSHAHSDAHSEHSQSHSEHLHPHSQPHTDTHSHSHTSTSQPDNHIESGSCDSSMNDNMRGIFLHILADTLGSVGVVILTILTRFFSWQGFDPVASIIIALLIFFSALPLMKSTASTLLLKLDTTKEATIRSALNDIASIKGVKSFSTPRFWSSENTLQGYLHVQIYRGENSVYLRRQCVDVFRKHKVEAMIQMENDYDPCWCRKQDGV